MASLMSDEERIERSLTAAQKLGEALRRLHEENIRERAYLKWLDAGSPDGGELWFWLQAEQEYNEEQRRCTPFSTLTD
jgi:hypothetical protein